MVANDYLEPGSCTRRRTVLNTKLMLSACLGRSISHFADGSGGRSIMSRKVREIRHLFSPGLAMRIATITAYTVSCIWLTACAASGPVAKQSDVLTEPTMSSMPTPTCIDSIQESPGHDVSVKPQLIASLSQLSQKQTDLICQNWQKLNKGMSFREVNDLVGPIGGDDEVTRQMEGYVLLAKEGSKSPIPEERNIVVRNIYYDLQFVDAALAGWKLRK